MGVDMWDRHKWIQEFTEHDVLVMTPQIFYDLSVHAHWSMDKVSLLVFDEVHHCQKRHPYAQIMADHYGRCPAPSRPKILGLTASPIWNIDKPLASLQQLEQSTHAKVLAVAINTEELQTHSPRPTERIYSYGATPDTYLTYPTPTLWDDCVFYFESTSSTEDHLRRIAKYTALLEAVGPYGADFWVMHELQQTLKETRNGKETALEELARRIAGESVEYRTPPMELQPIYDVLEQHSPRFAIDSPFHDSWLSPKFLCLVDILTSSSSPTFQGIVFTGQRHVASVLAWMLARVPTLKWVRCTSLTGHGISRTRDAVITGNGMQFNVQRDTVAKFRDGTYNLVIATNVAEEGLDFQACHLVVRFDPLQTLVGYVQSRGRARRANSEYIIMLKDGDSAHRQMYERLVRAEPALKARYQRDRPPTPPDDADDGDDDWDENELQESFTIQSTGATLTSYSCIPMLANLCSLIPRDQYCPVFRLSWELISYSEGSFSANLTLPHALPLVGDIRTFVGPVRRGKGSAKRSAAYIAMRKLLELEVFDKYLTPDRLQRGDNAVDADGNGMTKTSDMKPVIAVRLHDPFGNLWLDNSSTWLHEMYIDGTAHTGLLSACALAPFESHFPTTTGTKCIRLGPPISLSWPTLSERRDALCLIDDFFLFGVRQSIAGYQIPSQSSPYYLVPVIDGAVDYRYYHSLPGNPQERRTGPTSHLIRPFHCLPSALSMTGSLCSLIAIRDDLSPLSTPPPGSRESDYPSYRDYFTEKRGARFVPPDQPLFELRVEKRHQVLSSTLDRVCPARFTPVAIKSHTLFIPRNLCRRLQLPFPVFDVFRLFPTIVRHITDIYRATLAQARLKLPKLELPLLLEALTLPVAGVNYSYQRFETLGDAVLKLTTAVHVFNKYPYRHEGQLDILRANSINNTFLLSRARKIEIQPFFIAERTIAKWKPPRADQMLYHEGDAYTAEICFNRKAMPDVMESLLGVSYFSGGIDAALQTGTALDLCLGGSEPWLSRGYGPKHPVEGSQHTDLLGPLESSLCYTFRNSKLLLEALCHPTFRAPDTSSYQRLEFLGDVTFSDHTTQVIDLYVTEYLFLKYPLATPGQITWAKSRAVCNPTLGTLSGRNLSLHKFMLAYSPKLEASIQAYIELSDHIPYSQLVVEAWNWDPPKAMADLFEAVFGAVFVDSGFDIKRTFQVLAPIMTEVLAVVSPDMPKDPISELMIWAARHGCTAIKFQKSQSDPSDPDGRFDCMSVLVHGVDVSSPM
ncbi:hypothetical protein BS47DRAFT_1431689, partial [Hydnum rufescens UP504]